MAVGWVHSRPGAKAWVGDGTASPTLYKTCLRWQHSLWKMPLWVNASCWLGVRYLKVIRRHKKMRVAEAAEMT